MSGWGDQPQGPHDPYRQQGYGGGYDQGFGPGPNPPGYGPGPYPPYGGYYPAPETDSKAIGALIAAIAAYVICPIVPAIVALMLARDSDVAIQQSGGRLTGTTLNKVARVLSWINLLMIPAALLMFLLLGFAIPLG